MAIRRNPELGRRAVMLLATVFVVLIGATVTAFTVLSAAERGWQAWTVWACLFAGVAWMLWCLLDKPDKGSSILQLFRWRWRAKVDPLSLYKPSKRKIRPESPWGSNQPPTLESLRESSQESSVTWVPHGIPPARERKKH